MGTPGCLPGKRAVVNRPAARRPGFSELQRRVECLPFTAADDLSPKTMTTPAASPSQTHSWRFFRAGGFDQVRLDTGADLLAIEQLDQKLWVALACPASGLEFDTRTLAMIDTDKDGRVRASELIAAIKWAGGLLKNPDDLLKEAPALPLAAINDATVEGQTLLASARQILANLGKKDAAAISVEDTADTAKIFAATAFNGDGVIVAESASDPATAALIGEVVACLGPEPDRSGKPGTHQAKVDQFFADCATFDAWLKKSEAEAAVILPLGANTPAAAAAYRAVKAKVDDFFGRCRLAAFDPRALAALNREEKEYLTLVAKDLTITAGEVAGFPLAAVAAGRSLPLKTGINPAWASDLAALQATVVKPLLGDKVELSEADWAGIGARLAPYEAWAAAKPATRVEKLGAPRIREILAGPGKDALAALIAKDRAEEGKVNAITTVEKLVRYHRDLYLLAVNFVNFKDFYDRGEPAVFQAGTLYLDQRSCELCLRVEDAAKHATMASLAGSYLAYCDCVRKGSNEKMQIVVAFTDGDSDNLMVGRNGIFYDRKGRDWDATITKIIDNPISLRQAFWAPYKKFVRMIEEQIAKRAAAADAESASKLEAAAVAAAQTKLPPPPAAPAPAAPAPGPKKVDVGTVAALGVAFGAIGAFFTTLLGYVMGVVKLGPLAIAGSIVGVILLISGPSLVLAFIKLRKRNLGPILDANGWAVNAKAKVNLPFGKSLTQVAKLPPGSQRDLTDPYAEKKSPWPAIVGLVLLAYAAYAGLNHLGYIHQWTNGRLGIEKKPATSQTTPPATLPATGTTNTPPAA